MQKSTLVLAYEAGLRPFEAMHMAAKGQRDAGDIAAHLLGDRNTYFSRENRKRFGTKVHSLETLCARLVLGAVESAQPAEPVGAPRRFRAVLISCDGVVIHQTADTRVLDQHAANVELQYEASKLNESEMLRQLVERHLKTLRKMLDNAEKVLSTIFRQGP